MWYNSAGLCSSGTPAEPKSSEREPVFAYELLRVLAFCSVYSFAKFAIVYPGLLQAPTPPREECSTQGWKCQISEWTARMRNAGREFCRAVALWFGRYRVLSPMDLHTVKYVISPLKRDIADDCSLRMSRTLNLTVLCIQCCRKNICAKLSGRYLGCSNITNLPCTCRCRFHCRIRLHITCFTAGATQTCSKRKWPPKTLKKLLPLCFLPIL